MTQQELEKLYHEAYKPVYWTALSILKNKEDAEDVVQETFISAFEHYDSLEDKSKAVAWVKKIAANKSLNIVTRRRTVNVDDEVLEETEDIGEDFLPDSIIESEEKRKIIMDIIHNTLSEDTAMTIILFYFDEMSIKEIAEALHIPQGTVLSRLNYAKKKIKKEVEKYEKDNKDKLFTMGIPFLTKLFEKEAEQVVFKPMPASLLNLFASSKAAGATAVSAAAKASAVIIARNIVVGILAAGTIGTLGFFGYRSMIRPKDKTPESSITGVNTGVSEEESGSSDEFKETKKNINVLGMTPDQLDLHGGYVRTGTSHNYHDDTDETENTLYYSADGLLVLECAYNEENVLIYSDYYTYDPDGRITREEHWDASDKTYGLYKEYTYGAFGIERMDSGYFEKEPKKYEVYEYDTKGRLIKVTRYNTGSDKVFWYCDYEYADDGTYTTRITDWDILKQKMVQSKDYCRYSADGKLLDEYRALQAEHFVYTYDSQGKLTLMEHSYGKQLNDSTTYEYDGKGRLIRKTKLYGKKEWMSYTYEYKDL
ncbi:MAG: sigma-70 family RNA polymerase sigma factor [Clostridiales bacterium]|nr:sigma-70 family RNA polymerase sigma factor [Clostridiales bacterium]